MKLPKFFQRRSCFKPTKMECTNKFKKQKRKRNRILKVKNILLELEEDFRELKDRKMNDLFTKTVPLSRPKTSFY